MSCPSRRTHLLRFLNWARKRNLPDPQPRVCAAVGLMKHQESLPSSYVPRWRREVPQRLNHWRMVLLPRTLDSAITRCCLLGIVTIACLMPAQNDTWWHLRAGQEMLSRGFVMLSDEFSFTVTGTPWPNHEWLSEVVFYLVYRIGGLPGLTLLAAAAVSAALVLSWRLMAGAPTQRVLIMAVALTSIVPVWTLRPHVFSLVLLMVVLHLALRERYWPIPFVFVVWANLHGGVALGLVLLGAIAVSTLYVSGLSRLRPVVLVTAASFAATLITPLGPSLWSTIVESVHKSTANQIIEWRPASPFDVATLAFWVTAALLPVTAWICRRSIRAKDHVALTVVSLALLPLALRSSRNIPPFLLVAVPALSHTLADWLKPSRRARNAENLKLNAALLSACVIGTIVIVSVAWSTPAGRLNWKPMPQVVATEAQACGDRVYNAYADGGYLIWFAPGVRVFIDSRQDPYPLSFVQEYIHSERTGNYHQLFKRYDIRCAVLREPSAIATQLETDGWRTRVQVEDWVVLQATDRSETPTAESKAPPVGHSAGAASSVAGEGHEPQG